MNIIKLMKSSNSKLSELIKGLSMIKSQEVFDAMMKIDRGQFCDSSSIYEDCPQ
jgi:hypothetical protein